jgi:type IV secretory pathway TrbL component
MHLSSNFLISIRLLNLNVMLVGLEWVMSCYKKENLLHILVKSLVVIFKIILLMTKNYMLL